MKKVHNNRIFYEIYGNNNKLLDQLYTSCSSSKIENKYDLKIRVIYSEETIYISFPIIIKFPDKIDIIDKLVNNTEFSEYLTLSGKTKQYYTTSKICNSFIYDNNITMSIPFKEEYDYFNFSFDDNDEIDPNIYDPEALHIRII